MIFIYIDNLFDNGEILCWVSDFFVVRYYFVFIESKKMYIINVLIRIIIKLLIIVLSINESIFDILIY